MMRISEFGGLKLLKEDVEDFQKKGELCPMEAELLLDLIELAERGFHLDREADWLANRLKDTSISQCRFCPDGIKQHKVICQCAKTWLGVQKDKSDPDD